MIFTTTNKVVCSSPAKMVQFNTGNNIGAKWTAEQEVVLDRLCDTISDRSSRHFTSDKGQVFIYFSKLPGSEFSGDNLIAVYHVKLLQQDYAQCGQLPQQQISGGVHLDTGHLDHQSSDHDLQQDCDQCGQLPQQQGNGGVHLDTGHLNHQRNHHDHIPALHHWMNAQI